MIATMKRTTKRGVSDTVHTKTSFPEESRSRTDEPVVVECLYDRNVRLLAGEVYGWRNHREGIVDVNNVRSERRKD
jgi:hypothetical protein